MFVRVTHMDIAPERFDAAVERFRDKAVTTLESKPGFLRTILTGDAGTGKATAITMWLDAKSEDAGDGGSSDPIIGVMSELLTGDMQTSGYPEIFEREF